MNQTLMILAGSAAAVAFMVAVSAWARIARPTPPLDNAAARALIADEFPDHNAQAPWLAADGYGAVARAGDEALVVFRLGDGWVSRSLPWTKALSAPVRSGKVHFRLDDPACPRARLTVSGVNPWPPAGHADDQAETLAV